MRSPLKALLITGSLAAAIFGAAVPAVAATAGPAAAHPKPSPSPSPTTSQSPPPAPVAPTLITTNFACSNGVCEMGPGNVGMAFATGLDAVGQQCGTEGETNPEVMGVATGSLPPGLQFGGQGQQTNITGTPTKAGTYPFVVQLANVNFASGQICGPTATQQLTITIATGSSDRPVIKGGRLERPPGQSASNRVRRQHQRAVVGVGDLDRKGAYLEPAESHHLPNRRLPDRASPHRLPLPPQRARPHRYQQPRVFGHGTPRAPYLLNTAALWQIGIFAGLSVRSTAPGCRT